MGPPPKPTALKRLEGNTGKRPLNDLEPEPKAGEPEIPADLGEQERTAWRRYVPILLEMKCLTEADGPALAIMCRVEVELMELRNQEEFKGKGQLIYGLRSQHLALLREFGMTPSSRSRIRVEKDKDQARGGVLNGQWLGQRKKPGRKPGGGAVPPMAEDAALVQ